MFLSSIKYLFRYFLYFYVGIGYIVVSSTHFCGHSNGGYPARCYKQGVSDCENKCDSFEWCTSYSSNGGSSCSLMTSAASCPSGYNFLGGHFALSLEQLRASALRGHNCMFKNGKIGYQRFKY